MKKVIKNNIFGFILGVTIMCGIGVMAVDYLYNANNVLYKKDNNTDVSVKDSLDELYELSESTKGKIYKNDDANFNIPNSDTVKILDNYVKFSKISILPICKYETNEINTINDLFKLKIADTYNVLCSGENSIVNISFNTNLYDLDEKYGNTIYIKKESNVITFFNSDAVNNSSLVISSKNAINVENYSSINFSFSILTSRSVDNVYIGLGTTKYSNDLALKKYSGVQNGSNQTLRFDIPTGTKELYLFFSVGDYATETVKINKIWFE